MSVLSFPVSQSPDRPRGNVTAARTTLRFAPLPRVTALRGIDRLQGTSNPLLMQADDGHLYVVKLSTNPFSHRVVVNEYLAFRLARGLGLATPEAAIVQVPEGHGVSAGPHFGSRMPRSRRTACIHEWLPAPAWRLVENRGDLAGAYVFDAWTANADCRQFIFLRRPGIPSLRLYLIDNGHCFGAYGWRLPGIAVQCPVNLRFAYEEVTCWQDFEPWLSRIEGLERRQIQEAADGMPTEWLSGSERAAFDHLLGQLDERRLTTRALIAGCIDRRTHPFTRWRYRSCLFLAPAGRAVGKTA